MARAFMIGCLMPLATLTAAPWAVAQLPDPVTDGRAAVVGYASNVQAFPFYRVRYKTTKATAASIEDALAGRWRDAVSVDTLYLLDGVFERLDRDAGPPPVAPRNSQPGGGPTLVSAPFSSENYIAGEPGAVSYVPGLRAANLYQRELGDLGMVTSTPLSMGVMGNRNKMGPDRLQVNSDYTTDYPGRRVIDGAPLVGARFTKKDSGEAFAFWLDPARGYLPARIEFTGVDKRVSVTRLIAARDCGGRWFPERVLKISPTKVGPSVNIMELSVLEFDADNRPRPDDFAVRMPVDTQILRRSDSFSYKLKQDETVYARDLAAFFAVSDQVKANPMADTAAPAPSWVWPGWTKWLALPGVVLVIGGVASVIRRRKRTAV